MNHRPANLATAMLPHVILRHDGEAVADAERTLADALHSIRSHLGMEVAFISEFVDCRRVFRQVDSQLDPVPIRVGGSDALAESYCQRIIDGRLPELTPPGFPPRWNSPPPWPFRSAPISACRFASAMARCTALCAASALVQTTP